MWRTPISKLGRRVWIAVVAVGLVCAGGVGGALFDRLVLRQSVAAISPLPRKTAVEVFAPWTVAAKLAPGVRVVGHLTDGTCWTRSIADSADPGGWRCGSAPAHGIYDPCFAPPTQADAVEVACAASPWSGVYMLRLAHPLTFSQPWTLPKRPLPWFMQLADGERCGLNSGAASEAAGVTLNYNCTSGTASVPDTGTEPWTVQYLAHDSHVISAVDVVTAWH